MTRLVQKRIWVGGKVQGVFFRASAVREAARIGDLKGYVRNLPDGRVEAVACGLGERVTAFVEWCRQGPPAARIESFEVREEQPEPGLPPFCVK